MGRWGGGGNGVNGVNAVKAGSLYVGDWWSAISSEMRVSGRGVLKFI